MLPIDSRTDGKSRALGMVTALGWKPCWWHCFQKLTKSGGIMTPETRSQPAALNLLISEVKSSVPSW